jgi:hypothetical protein
MLTTLTAMRQRLALVEGDNQYDALLTGAIAAVSARFERECNRVFGRTVGATEEFGVADTEVVPRCYPVEAVTKFELKASEDEGWLEQTGVSCVVRGGCVISLSSPLSVVTEAWAGGPRVARVTYTGGYVLPGTAAEAGQAALPADVEWAAVEQTAAWFQQRERLGLIRYWPKDGVYLVFSQLALLPQVEAVLGRHRRWAV